MSELGPWAGLYNWAIEKLMLERMVAERDVLAVLAIRANPLGFCWPGTGYIANLIGRMDSTVEKSLLRLEMMEFICICQTENLVRNRIDIDYQLSPAVFFIAPDKQELAFQLWRQNRNIKITNEIKESQPTTEPTTEPESGTQHQLSSTLTNNNNKQLSVKMESPGATVNPATPNPENANAENRESDSATGAKTPAVKPQSPNPTPVPRAPSPLVSYDVALTDDAAESLAARMNAETRYMLSVATARGLVVRYGTAKCEAALVHMARQTNIRQPAAYLRSTIQRREIDPVQDAKIRVEAADEEVFSEYISGKYAAYIKYKPDENEQESRDE